MKIKSLAIVFFLLLLTSVSQAQFFQRSEFGLTGGGMNYIGDINTKYNFYNTKMMLGVIYRYNFTPRWVLKVNALFGSVGADDKHFDNIRNLNFKSKINEVGAT